MYALSTPSCRTGKNVSSNMSAELEPVSFNIGLFLYWNFGQTQYDVSQDGEGVYEILHSSPGAFKP